MAQVSPLRRRMIEDMTVRNMGIVSLTSWECAAAKGRPCRLPVTLSIAAIAFRRR
jgi:hypothetical protein